MKACFAIAMLGVISGTGYAQGPRGPRAGGVALAGSNLDMTEVQTVAGTVTAVNIGYGMEYPSIAVNKQQIKLAPVWYLLDNGFEVKTGDSVTVAAAPSKLAYDSYLYAVELTNLVSKWQIALRDSSGVPLWTGGSGRYMGGSAGTPMGLAGCVDASTSATASGTIDKIAARVGIQMTTLVLKTPDGKLLTFKLGPERILLAADIELKSGDKVTVVDWLGLSDPLDGLIVVQGRF